MSTHSLPARVLPESQPATAGVSVEGHTLTLPLRFAPGAMAGRLEIRDAVPTLPDTVHLRVTQPAQEPLNFTA